DPFGSLLSRSLASRTLGTGVVRGNPPLACGPGIRFAWRLSVSGFAAAEDLLRRHGQAATRYAAAEAVDLAKRTRSRAARCDHFERPGRIVCATLRSGRDRRGSRRSGIAIRARGGR